MNLKKEAAVALTLVGLFLVTLVVTVNDDGFPFNSSETQTAAVSDFNSSLVAHYTFDDGTASDSSGNGNNGDVNGATTVEGKLGQGLRFDGVDDHIQTTSDFIGTTAISVCMWLLPPSVPAETFVSNGKLIFGSSSSNRIKLLSDGSTTANSATNSVTNNKWNFICGTRDTSGTANLYVNGTLSGTANQSSGTPTAGIASVRIGGAVTGGGYLIGSIDDLRIYNRVLSVGEIAELYAYPGENLDQQTSSMYDIFISKRGNG